MHGNFHENTDVKDQMKLLTSTVPMSHTAGNTEVAGKAFPKRHREGRCCGVTLKECGAGFHTHGNSTGRCDIVCFKTFVRVIDLPFGAIALRL